MSGPVEPATLAEATAEIDRLRRALRMNGDDPDVVVISYGRENAAVELVTDLLGIVPPAEWRTLALSALDRELLGDDEFWAALQRRRRRIAGRAIRPGDLPSLSTRVAVAHQLLVADMAYKVRPDAMEPADAVRTVSGRVRHYEYTDARRIAYRRSEGRCEAAGLHHRECPGTVDGARSPDTFITHHIYPRERAKQDGMLDDPLLDHPGNLLVVWNGHTGLGAGGCHRRIHTERALAHELGYLQRDLDHVVP